MLPARPSQEGFGMSSTRETAMQPTRVSAILATAIALAHTNAIASEKAIASLYRSNPTDDAIASEWLHSLERLHELARLVSNEPQPEPRWDAFCQPMD